MGSIITFYSYKGGVGRTMALANIALVLAKRGLKILMVDFDLEAPGLINYFRDYVPKLGKNSKGMLEILNNKPKNAISSDNYSIKIEVPDAVPITLIPSGRYDESYNKRVLEFDWPIFFTKRDGGKFIESLREQWINKFDITLIDSRTGITDSGGVCTIQLPDILVPVLIPNQQTLDGTGDVISRVQRARNEFDWDRPPATILPLISRFDSRAEYAEGQEWLSKISDTLDEYFTDWLPKRISPLKILERTKIPYVAKFGFGEKLAVQSGSTTDPEGLGYAYETIAALLFHDFKSAEKILTDRDQYVREMEFNFKWDIFFSFTNEDNTIGKHILNYFKKAGFSTWSADMIQSGENALNVSHEAMKKTRLLVFLFTENTIKSKFFYNEFYTATRIVERSNEQQTIVPLLFKTHESALPFNINMYQGLVISKEEDIEVLTNKTKEILERVENKSKTLFVKSSRFGLFLRIILNRWMSKKSLIIKVIIFLLFFVMGVFFSDFILIMIEILLR